MSVRGHTQDMSVHPDGSRLPGASDIESGVMDASRKGMSAADVGKDAAAWLGEAAKASAGLSYARFRALIRWVALVLLWLIVVCLILGSSRQFLSITSYEPGADGLPPVITIDMKAKDTSSQWPFAPAGFADATDHCNVLITNPCKAPYMQPYREGEFVCPYVPSACDSKNISLVGGQFECRRYHLHLSSAPFWVAHLLAQRTL